MGNIQVAPAALRPAPGSQPAEAGYVDFYGYASAAGGWHFATRRR